MSMAVGQIWDAPLGNRRVNWRVTWVGTKKARLKADIDYGTATATVTIARWIDSPDTDLISSASTTGDVSSPPSTKTHAPSDPPLHT